MDALVDSLAQRLLTRLQSHPPTRRLLVGISGVPGSGKSTFAHRLVHRLNRSHPSLAVLIGMDGWHLPRSALSQMPDPQLAFDRRGAEFTFDATRFSDFIASLRSNRERTLCAPSFDHAKKDPVEDDIPVEPQNRIVVVEGLYCNCKVGEWGRAAREMDERWVCIIDRETVRERLVKRHVNTGVARDQKEAQWRGEYKRGLRARLSGRRESRDG
ncbi:hypothetical protein ACQY0O_004191 [Thecaphora frezii]